jgi:hypothetical protein
MLSKSLTFKIKLLNKIRELRGRVQNKKTAPAEGTGQVMRKISSISFNLKLCLFSSYLGNSKGGFSKNFKISKYFQRSK